MENGNISRQFNKDELFLLAIHMDLPTLLNFCVTDKRHEQFCNTNRIWDYKLQKEFSEYKNDFKDMTSKEKYKLLYGLNILKKHLKLNASLVWIYNTPILNLEYRMIEHIPKEISLLKNLQILNLGNTYGARFNLQHLNDDEINNLRNKIKILPKEIGQLKKLAYINLRDNKIKTLPKEIGQLTNLKELHLEENKIEYIPEEIGRLYNLEELDLHSNKIKFVPKELTELKKLRKLTLFNNYGLSLKDLPEELRTLRLSGKLNIII